MVNQSYYIMIIFNTKRIFRIKTIAYICATFIEKMGKRKFLFHNTHLMLIKDILNLTLRNKCNKYNKCKCSN